MNLNRLRRNTKNGGNMTAITPPGGGELLPINEYTERSRPKGVPFSGWRYIKG